MEHMIKNGYFTPKRKQFELTSTTLWYDNEGNVSDVVENWQNCGKLHSDRMWYQNWFTNDNCRNRMIIRTERKMTK